MESWAQMIKPRCRPRRHLICLDFRVMIFVFQLVKKSKDSSFGSLESDDFDQSQRECFAHQSCSGSTMNWTEQGEVGPR